MHPNSVLNESEINQQKIKYTNDELVNNPNLNHESLFEKTQTQESEQLNYYKSIASQSNKLNATKIGVISPVPEELQTLQSSDTLYADEHLLFNECLIDDTYENSALGFNNPWQENSFNLNQIQEFDEDQKCYKNFDHNIKLNEDVNLFGIDFTDIDNINNNLEESYSFVRKHNNIIVKKEEIEKTNMDRASQSFSSAFSGSDLSDSLSAGSESTVNQYKMELPIFSLESMTPLTSNEENSYDYLIEDSSSPLIYNLSAAEELNNTSCYENDQIICISVPPSTNINKTEYISISDNNMVMENNINSKISSINTNDMNNTNNYITTDFGYLSKSTDDGLLDITDVENMLELDDEKLLNIILENTSDNTIIHESTKIEITDDLVEDMLIESPLPITKKAKSRKRKIYEEDITMSPSAASTSSMSPGPTPSKRRGRPPKIDESFPEVSEEDLTDENRYKYLIMRNQNNIASRRSRFNRRQRELEIEKESADLENEYIKLVKDEKRLQKECERWRKAVIKLASM